MSEFNRTMAVEIRFTVMVDPEAWADHQGVELDEVRADVKTYYGNVVGSTNPGETGYAA